MPQSVVRIRPVILVLGPGDVDILHKLNSAGLLDKVGILRTPSTAWQDFALQRALLQVHPSLYFVSDLPLGNDPDSARATFIASMEAGTKVQLLPTDMPDEVCASLFAANLGINLVQVLSDAPTREDAISANLRKLDGIVIPPGYAQIARGCDMRVISRLNNLVDATPAKEDGSQSVPISLALIKEFPIEAIQALLTIFQQDT
jgi:hypothetical protein